MGNDFSTDKFLASYVETALWSSTDDSGEPLDSDTYADTELAERTVERMRKDCTAFRAMLEPLLSELDGQVINSMPDSRHIAHDFWLTRNGHGAGFWDGDYPKPLGDQLTKISKIFGSCDLYLGDDGKFYLM